MSAATTTELTIRRGGPRSPSLPTFFNNLDSFAETPEGVAKLRELILDLAVRGKLVEQDENDEPASELLDLVEAEKARLVQAGSLKKAKLPPVIDDAHSNGVPSGWSVVRLGSCIALISGQHLKPDQYNEDGDGHPYLTGPADFGDLHPTATRWTHEERAIAVEGDILVTVKGAGIGKTNVLATPTAFVSRQLMAVRPILLDRDFVRLVLLHTYDKFQSQGVGIAIPGIGRDDILHHIFWLPPLSEQRRIVSKVDGLMSLCDELESRGSERVRLRQRASRSSLDRLVRSRSRRDLSGAWRRLSDHFEALYDAPDSPETLAHLRQSILQLAVQGKLVPQDPNDEPAAVLLERIRSEQQSATNGKKRKTATAEPINSDDHPFELPPSWQWSRFSEVAAIASNLVKPAAFQDVPHIAPNNIEKETGILLDYCTVAEDEVRSSNHRFFGGQILYSKIRPNLSKAVLIDFDGLCSADMYPIDAHIFSPYLLKYILSDTFLGMVVKTDTRVAMPKTNQAELNKVLVAVPPLAEQKRIVAKVDQLLSRCDALSARLRERRSATQDLLAATVHRLLDDTRPGTPEPNP